MKKIIIIAVAAAALSATAGLDRSRFNIGTYRFGDKVPGVWLLANVSSDGREMLLTVDNLSGDVRESVGFRIGAGWRGAAVSRLREDGAEEPLGRAGSTWHAPVALGSMLPEYFILKRNE